MVSRTKHTEKSDTPNFSKGCFAEFNIRDISAIQSFLENLFLSENFDLLISIHTDVVQFYGINKTNHYYQFMVDFCGKKPKRFVDYIDFLWKNYTPKEMRDVMQYIKREYKNIKRKKEVK